MSAGTDVQQHLWDQESSSLKQEDREPPQSVHTLVPEVKLHRIGEHVRVVGVVFLNMLVLHTMFCLPVSSCSL